MIDDITFFFRNRLTFFYFYLRKIIILNVFFLGVMTLFRVVFFIKYSKGIKFDNLYFDVFRSFFLGLRFDLSVLAYFTFIIFFFFILFIVLVKKYSFFIKFITFIRFYYTFVFMIIVFLLFADFSFYSYFQDHFNFMIFGLIDGDFNAVVTTMVKHFNIYIPAIGLLVFTILVYKITGKIFSKFDISKFVDKTKMFFNKKFLIKNSFFLIFILFFNLLAGRGTVALFPLNKIDVGFSSNLFINQTSYNGIYALFDIVKDRLTYQDSKIDVIQSYGYKNKLNMALSDLLSHNKKKYSSNVIQELTFRTKKNNYLKKLKPHVILIAMESMGTVWINNNSEQFDVLGSLKKHITEDIFFRKFFPATGYSAGSITSLLINLPNVPSLRTLSESKYARIKMITSAASVYHKEGYETSFIYGGKLGWRNIDLFSKTQGFDNQEGEPHILRHYKNNHNILHPWGVHDEYLFNYILNKLNTKKKPQFMIIFTTSNHPPFNIPKSYKKKEFIIPSQLKDKVIASDELVQKRFNAYRYSMQELSSFLDKIKNSKLRDRTIVAATGDHNFYDVVNFPQEEILDKYGVPLYLYIPLRIKPKFVNTNQFGSHKDIITTLYNISLSDISYISVGSNLFDNRISNYGVFYQTAFNNELCVGVSPTQSVYQNFNEQFFTKRIKKPLKEHIKAEKYMKSLISLTKYLMDSQ